MRSVCRLLIVYREVGGNRVLCVSSSLCLSLARCAFLLVLLLFLQELQGFHSNSVQRRVRGEKEVEIKGHSWFAPDHRCVPVLHLT